MRLKHLIIAVTVVVVAGFVTGLAFGGKETVVVTKEVPAKSTPAPRSAASDDADAVATTAENDDEPAPADLAATYLSDVGSVTGSDDIGDLDTNASAQLQDGKTYDYSTVFTLSSLEYSDADFYTVEIPVPEGKSRFQARAGFAKGTPTMYGVGLSYVADKLAGGKVLRSERQLDATDDDAAEIDVSGVRTLIVKLRPRIDDIAEWESPQFVLADARFT